jgi:SP family sugar:H+ symporter-like MFS transporter
MTTASNWLLNWAIAYSTPYMVDKDHANLGSKVFFVWGSFCFVCVAFVYLMIYETKGLSLEQVDELYGVVNVAWKSKDFRPQVRFGDMEGTEGGKMSMSEVAENQERKRSVQHDEQVPGVGTQEGNY